MQTEDKEQNTNNTLTQENGEVNASADENMEQENILDEAVETVTVTVEEWNDLKQQVDENQNRFLRAQADLDNFRRRTRLEREELVKYASAKLVEALLPALDNLERAIHASKQNSDMESLTKGVEMVFRQMEQTMVQEGLQAIEAVGQPFNPEHHQAVMQEEVEGTESGIVVEELQKGYMLKDKVIRPSMVKVST
jgi:molecular chaperone GrpE